MTVDEKTWYLVFLRDHGICQYCGMDLLASLSAFCVATVDHVVSRNSGGSDDPANLVLSCSGCNSLLSKAQHLTSFAERKRYIQRQHASKQEWFADFRSSFTNVQKGH